MDKRRRNTYRQLQEETARGIRAYQSMRVIFHLGMLKTGSTTLQHTLLDNCETLSDAGFLYPRIGMRFRGRRDKRHLALSHLPDGSARQSKLFRELLSALENADEAATILSSESWCSLDRFSGLRRLVRVLNEAGHTCEAVMFLRNRHDFARSHYREWVQNWNNALPFPRYVVKRRQQWDYVGIVRRMNELFAGNVRYIVYARQTDSVTAFREALNLPPMIRSQPRNPSLTAVQAEAARQLNARNLPQAEFLGRIMKRLSDLVAADYCEDIDQPVLRPSEGEAALLANLTGLAHSEIGELLRQPAAPIKAVGMLRGRIGREIEDLHRHSDMSARA